MGAGSLMSPELETHLGKDAEISGTDQKNSTPPDLAASDFPSDPVPRRSSLDRSGQLRCSAEDYRGKVGAKPSGGGPQPVLAQEDRRPARCRLEVTVQHVGIEIHPVRPDDSPSIAVDSHPGEHLWIP